MASNMGLRYIGFRLGREMMSRTGLLKFRFPLNPEPRTYISLADWKRQQVNFFFRSGKSISVTQNPCPELKKTYEDIRSGKILFFNSVLMDLGADYNWITNPDTGHIYDISLHWTQISDFSADAGDIKYVWEKSRFAYLMDVIRYDYHFGQDCAAFVFREILSWIEHNPVNYGPNYRCSQEMSLRVLNWTFALYYYRDSKELTESVFFQIQNAIYHHLRHIRDNINFSRIAVRNNHALTETLCLYLCGLLYPALPGSEELKRLGKKWFEEEIAYQIYEDGTFLQFSMNYHRVAVQLLTWAITLSEKNNDRFAPVVYQRALKSLVFLRTCMNVVNGWLPNYGNNDGALFFRYNNAHFRDYHPQLDALASAIGLKLFLGKTTEETGWYGLKNASECLEIADGTHSFPIGGYYVIREPATLTFIRCGNHHNRPLQADNLHVDIWYHGQDLLIDAGSYKYNTDEQTLRYFSGSRSHNTVMLNDKDQMQKGIRFIWYFWTQRISAIFRESEDDFEFSGSITAFRQIKKGIVHKRTIRKTRDKPEWIITDEVSGAPDNATITQLWHLHPENAGMLTFCATDGDNSELKLYRTDGWYSGLYGYREKSEEYYFCTNGAIISTTISVAG